MTYCPDDAANQTLLLTLTTNSNRSVCELVIRFLILVAARPFLHTHTHTHTHPFNGPLSGTTRVSRYQKGKTNLDFTGARDSEWQWHRLGRTQVCTSLQTDNHANTPPLVFNRPDALPAAQPTASKHCVNFRWRKAYCLCKSSEQLGFRIRVSCRSGVY